MWYLFAVRLFDLDLICFDCYFAFVYLLCSCMFCGVCFVLLIAWVLWVCCYIYLTCIWGWYKIDLWLVWIVLFCLGFVMCLLCDVWIGGFDVCFAWSLDLVCFCFGVCLGFVAVDLCGFCGFGLVDLGVVYCLLILVCVLCGLCLLRFGFFIVGFDGSLFIVCFCSLFGLDVVCVWLVLLVWLCFVVLISFRVLRYGWVWWICCVGCMLRLWLLMRWIYWFRFVLVLLLRRMFVCLFWWFRL